MPDAVELRWRREQLEPVFGPLSGRKAWHRLQERISKLGKDGRRSGIKLTASFDEGAVVLTARGAEALAAFKEKLGRAPGRVQRAFGALIAAAGAAGGPRAMAECLERQRGEVVRMAREPLRLFAELGALSGSVFIDPPYRLEGGPLKARGALAVLIDAAISPGRGGLMVVGPSGIGKSTLAGEAFRRFEHSPKADWSHPLFVPAAELSFDGSGAVEWERLPGVPAGLGPRLETLFREGRLLLILDGLDENVRLMDLSNPASWAFWGLASRNKCVITCRDRFYHLHFSCSPVERIFGGGLKVLQLPHWSPTEASALYAEIAQRLRGAGRSRALVDGLAHLGRLPGDVLREKMASFRLTGLTAWNFAIFFALHNGGKFPRNEYEILEYLVDQALRWEKGKTRGAEPLPVELLRGLLVHLGRIADGDRNGRKTWRVTPEAVLEVAGRFYPFLLERKDELFRALRQIPFLEYEAESGAFHLDYGLGCWFAARNVLAMGLEGDADRLREEFQTSLSFQAFVLLLQALSGLSTEDKRRFFDTGRRVFEDASRLYARERAEKHLQSMYEILEPLGNLGLPEAAEWLRDIGASPKSYPELVNLAAARALAYAGEDAGVDAYVRRLKKDAGARLVNRNYYVRWIWPSPDRPVDRMLHDPAPLQPDEHERICGWFARSLSGQIYRPLRHIHVFTLADILRLFGRGALKPGALRALMPALRRESESWSAAAKSDLRDLARLVEKHDPA